jgi:hypothetical protein
MGVLLAAFLDRPALLGERRRTGATLLRVRVTSVIKGRKCVIEWEISEKRTGTTGATAAALRGRVILERGLRSSRARRPPW